MAGKAGLMAGLIGLAVMLVVTLLNQFVIPIRGVMTYVSCGISMLLYVGIGVLAGAFVPPQRTAGKGAAAGAIAGLISGVVSGLLGFVIMSVRLARGGTIPSLDPQQMEQLAQLGMDLRVLMIPGAICGAGIGVGAAAAGGAIWGAVKPD
jgi:hypothetical protein